MIAARFAIILVICSVAATAFGANGLTRQYELVWELETGDDLPLTVVVDASGSIFVAGSTTTRDDQPTSEGESFYASMVNAAGSTLWTRRDLDGSVAAATFDPSGAVTIVGKTRWRTGTTSEDAFVMRIEANGVTRWERRLSPPDLPVGFGGMESFIDLTAVAADAEGNVAIVGNTLVTEGKFSHGMDTFVTLLDALGVPLWTRTLERFAPDSGRAVAFDAAGDVVIVGGAWGAIDGVVSSGTGAYVWKLDVAGRSRWITQFGALIDDTPTGVTTAADGTIIVIGSGYEIHDSTSGSWPFVRTFDVDGTPLWTRPVGHHPWDSAQGVIVDAHANVLVLVNPAGHSPTGAQAALWGFTADGEATGTSPLRQSDRTVGHAMTRDTAGAIVVVGTTRGSADSVHGFVVKMVLASETSDSDDVRRSVGLPPQR